MDLSERREVEQEITKRFNEILCCRVDCVATKLYKDVVKHGYVGSRVSTNFHIHIPCPHNLLSVRWG